MIDNGLASPFGRTFRPSSTSDLDRILNLRYAISEVAMVAIIPSMKFT
jgi:hypothetical protein